MNDKRYQNIPGILDGRKINRLEVIDAKGRPYVNNEVTNIELLIQDDGETLKIVVDKPLGS